MQSISPITAALPFDAQAALEAALPTQRARLKKLCAHLTGAAADADDLAQETLLEAWRSIAKLRDATGLEPWLSAIARNICLRWMRQHGHDVARRETPDTHEGRTNALLEERIADEHDPFDSLERAEIILLLERALALLPAATRQALIETYVHEYPQSEVAARLDMSAGHLRVRLNRGKHVLRAALTTDLREDALALGLALPDTPQWQQTRIWCPFCGRHALRYRPLADDVGGIFRCPGACDFPNGHVVGGVPMPHKQVLSQPKALLTQQTLTLGIIYRSALAQRTCACQRCGHITPIHLWSTLESAAAYVPATAGMALECPACGAQDGASLWHLLLDTPETTRFWREHTRMRALPEREIEMDGQPALVCGYQSVTDSARLEFISACDTLAILAIHRT